MHIYIDDVAVWFLAIITLSFALFITVFYRLHKWLSRRCTGAGCRSFRVDRVHHLSLLERPRGFWWNHFWVRAETSTRARCLQCGEDYIVKSSIKYVSRWHILWVIITASKQLKTDYDHESIMPGTVLSQRIRQKQKILRLSRLPGESGFEPKNLNVE